MRRQILVIALTVVLIPTFATAGTLIVRPGDSIQAAIEAASSTGETRIVVYPGVYSVPSSNGLDFYEKKITLQSNINPNATELSEAEWDIVANTVIDCQGSKSNERRAFRFLNNADSKVIGLTITNGFMSGGKGSGGYSGNLEPPPPPWKPWECDSGFDYIVPLDSNSPPRACNGQSSTGDGYGGAILCQNSSPTIRFCVIKNCTVAGGVGGKGGDGLDLQDAGPDYEWCWQTDDPNAEPECTQDGQFGGHGGHGKGTGHGGAIACLTNSAPIIENCIIKDNLAVGGIGGNGGNGGNAVGHETEWEGFESGGGRGGNGSGDGMGGAIYCDDTSDPTIERCEFINNTAKQGLGGEPGERGRGNVMDSPLDGQDPLDMGPGWGWNSARAFGDWGEIVYDVGEIAGGAGHFYRSISATFTDCNFSGNQAVHEIMPWWLPAGVIYHYDYEQGGALYCNSVNNVSLTSCRFIDNKAGAVYIEPEYIDTDPNFNSYTNKVQITAESGKGLFSGNTEAVYGGAVCVNGRLDDMLQITGYDFDNNRAYLAGGAIFSFLSYVDLKECSFNSNRAYYDDSDSYGGAVTHWGDGLVIRDCVFAGNTATYGGALHTDHSEIEEIAHSYFTGNTADNGGAISLEFSDVLDINSCKILNNRATSPWLCYGGGIDCLSSTLAIRNSEISNNIAEGILSYGGGLGFAGGPANHTVTNCLLKDNAANTGGGIAFTLCGKEDPNYVVAKVSNCTFFGNSAAAEGGGIFVDYDSEAEIIDSIFNNCPGGAIYEWGGEAAVAYSLFYENPDGDFRDTSGDLYWGPDDPCSIFHIPGSSYLIYDNPLFVDPCSEDSNPEDDFRLSQTRAGQSVQSPAVNTGSDASDVLGRLDTYTTRTDNVPDYYNVNDANTVPADANVDLGYHYSTEIRVPRYSLTVQVSGNGTVEKEPVQPVLGYPVGTVVELTASPAAGWMLESWNGTDDDTEEYLTNTTTMHYSRTVLIKFREVKTLSVGIDPDYPTIQSAIYDARNGDIVEVSPGVWKEEGIIIDKPITVRAIDSNHPEYTVIDSGDHGNSVIFSSDAGPGTVFEGFTVTGNPDWWWHAGHGDIGVDAGENGEDGGCYNGLGIYISVYASPVIRNCIIKHHNAEGGNGAEGSGADDSHHAGRGGWGGWARGAGVYCAAYSTPTFINCHIMENHARGGIGGNGGDYQPDEGRANYGGNWSSDTGQLNFDIDFAAYSGGKEENQPLWQIWRRHPETPNWDDAWVELQDPYLYLYTYIGDYRRYTGYGGGVFCNVGSDVKFIDCKIIGNRTSGGCSGEGGLEDDGPEDRVEPKYSYQLPSYGGGVYCAADANVTFTDCIIANNVAQEPNEYYHLDADLGHGGGVCAEDSATVTFENCLISGNKASDGGGLLLDHATPMIIDCVIRNNTAYEGGGITTIGGPATIIGSTIAFNTAGDWVTDPNKNDSPDDYDPNNDYYLPGYGGGIYSDSTDLFIIDSNISNNDAYGAGGGAFVKGETTPTLFNCLFKNNSADLGGGGIAVYLHSVTTLKNCTLANNSASGSYFADHFGGGLYCYDNATALVTNSILWDNSAEFGSQIAIDQGPATVDVNYSNVHGGAGAVYVGPGCTLIWPYDPNNPSDSPNLQGTAADKPDFVYGNLGSRGGEDGHSFLNTGSPCINEGSDKAKDVNMYRHTTRTDGELDGYYYDGPDAIVDLGYHYILRTDLTGDFNYDGVVDVNDYNRLTDPNVYWLKAGCAFPDFCLGTDLSKDGQVNFVDYAIFARNFKDIEKTPPQPNPMTWESPPTSPSEGSSLIVMTATEATDNSGGTIYYQFRRIYPGISEWTLSGRTYTVSGAVDSVYGYQVRACDDLNKTDDPNHVTEPSFPAYVRCGDAPPDREPPEPNPPLWEEEPHGVAAQSIAMTAAPVTDISGPVEYRFQYVEYLPDEQIKCDSGWQTSRDWTCTRQTFEEDDCYCCFRFKTRDAEENESKWSTELTGCTGTGSEPNEVDETPPVTDGAPVDDPYQAQWEVGGWPRLYTGEYGRYYHTMTAREASDDTGPVWYYFKCSSGTAPDRDWSTERTYTLQWNSSSHYKVKTRDSADPPNEGSWSEEGWTGTP